ncbi:MAG: energy transducer TonB [Deltaproteobacteria bacterium]|nr:energy transducer TonB [Deltaproteobacteria bacterium]
MGKFSKFLFLSLLIHAGIAVFFYFWPASLFLTPSLHSLSTSSLQLFQMGEESASFSSEAKEKVQAISVLKKRPLSSKNLVQNPSPVQSGEIGNPSSGSNGGEGPGTSSTSIPGKSSGGGSNLLALIRQKIEGAKRYPEAARLRAQEGLVSLRFKLGLKGDVESLNLVKSSGFKILDEEALATVRRAAPFPFYEEVVETSLRFTLPSEISAQNP